MIPYLIIVFIHWIADFVLQSDWMAKEKSRNDLALLCHVVVYTACWLPFVITMVLLLPTGSHDSKLLFLPITFSLHFATDFITSRINSKLWSEGKIHYFFVSVGFDQVLHYTQLFLTYQLLFT